MIEQSSVRCVAFKTGMQKRKGEEELGETDKGGGRFFFCFVFFKVVRTGGRRRRGGKRQLLKHEKVYACKQ